MFSLKTKNKHMELMTEAERDIILRVIDAGGVISIGFFGMHLNLKIGKNDIFTEIDRFVVGRGCSLCPI